jgi:uncharacterized protein (DUF433 family)/DNA-binding transcriptional MerR regulator
LPDGNTNKRLVSTDCTTSSHAEKVCLLHRKNGTSTMIPSRNHAAPSGVFSPYRAGALAGVSGYKLGQWARYGFIKPTLYRGRPANLYGFQDVAEAIVVHWLLDRGFSYDQIHGAINAARVEHPNWPLLTAPLSVAQHAVEGDPTGAIVLKVRKGVYVDTGRGSQITLRPSLLVHARDMLQRGGWLADELGLMRIEVDPTKLAGAPTVRGRRWPVERVAQLATDDEGAAILVDDYGLEDRDIDESCRWVRAAMSL